MKILLVTQYFHPEVTSCALRMDAFVREWTARGHEVTVLTAVPNHPEGVVRAPYRRKAFVREQRHGAVVLRMWVSVTPRRGALGRLRAYASFAVASALGGALLVDRPDVVVATTPPPIATLTGRLLAWRFRVPYVVDVRDLWPDAAVAVGALRHGPAHQVLDRTMKAIYGSADRVTAATEGFARAIGVGTVVVPNGADDRIGRGDAAPVRRSLGIGGRFVVGYVGNHGVCEGLEGLVDAAALLSDTPDVHVLMVGGGPRREALVDRAAGRTNITLLPPVAVDEVASYLSAADVLVVPLRNDEHFASRFPAKLYDAWFSGRPVLVGYDGEARRLVEQVGGGSFAVSDDSRALATEIRRLRDLPRDELERMGSRGRQWVEQNATRSVGADRIAELLGELVRSR